MKIIATVLVSLVLAAPAFASSLLRLENSSLYTFVDYFDWREYGSSQERLLKERGPFFGVGTELLLDLHARKLLTKTKAELFGSIVSYEGQTMFSFADPKKSERPVNTDVDYVGVRLEQDLRWRFPLQSFSIEPFAGVGVRWWLRGLHDSTAYDTDNVPFTAAGYTETWRSVYTTAGVRGEYRHRSDLNFFLEGGARYPFYVSNSVDFADLTLRPKGEWAAVGEVGAHYKRLRVSLHYEGFEVSASPAVAGFLQPQSSSDLFGAKIGLSF